MRARFILLARVVGPRRLVLAGPGRVSRRVGPDVGAVTSVTECSRTGDCERNTAEGAEVPPFVRINISRQLLISVDDACVPHRQPVAGERATHHPGTQNNRAWSA